MLFYVENLLTKGVYRSFYVLFFLKKSEFIKFFHISQVDIEKV